LTLRIAGTQNRAHLNVFIHDEALTPIVCLPVQDEAGEPLCLQTGQCRVSVPVGILELNAGKYSFVIGVRDASTSISLCRLQGVLPFRIYASKSH